MKNKKMKWLVLLLLLCVVFPTTAWAQNTMRSDIYNIDFDQPTISDIQITDVNQEGFTVNCRVADSVSGISKVMFPTWTSAGSPEQDDLIWHQGTLNGNIASYRVRYSDHKNEKCFYNIHILGYDNAGNVAIGKTSINIDATPPGITDVKVNNVTSTGYTITCKVSDNVGINRVQFPTWTLANGQDDLELNWNTSQKSSGIISGDMVTFQVKDSDHNYEKGIYRTHIYAYDNFGNSSYVRVEDVLSDTNLIDDEKPVEVISLTLDYFSTDKATNQQIGTNISLSTNASGGSAPYQYKYYAKLGNTTMLIQDYSKSDTAQFTPNQAGTYIFLVDVKDSLGNTATKSIDNFVIYEEKNNEPNVPDEDADVICSYQTHVENEGWQAWKTNGDMSGTSGKGLRLEGIKIKLDTDSSELGLSYATHVQNIGWQAPVTTGAMSGTSGKSLRLEAIKINLTGTKASQYDIYYRVHAQNIGWLDWDKNGEDSGTAGFGYRLEAIEIIVKAAGSAAPGKTDHPYMEDSPKSFVSGNTPGNLMNYGRVASENEMTYLSFYYHYNLYSRLSDGALLPYLEMEKPYNMNSLNIKNDWIYYSLRHVLGSTDTSLDGIYKMKTDGTKNLNC